MNVDDYVAKASSIMRSLCSVQPNRRTGSPGNRDATDFFASAIGQHGYEVNATPFDCLDYVRGEAVLAHDDRTYDIHISPYSLGCDVSVGLIVASTEEELESCDCEGRILLLKGPISSEQLMPKNFVFYNPEHHQRLIALLEDKRPAGIITATERKPDQVGALYPFPLIVDGDFGIPSVYCKDVVGEEIAEHHDATFHLRIGGQRISSRATNVLARRNPEALEKIVITAHIDAYEDSPGASDNASGTAVLLILAEMLGDYGGEKCIEIVALNGEDHYSVGGQMDYLSRYGDELGKIALVVNVDDVGYQKGRAAYSFYGCSPQIQYLAEQSFQGCEGLVRGDEWHNGDHMIFVQSGVPALAFTSDRIAELMMTVTHTSLDTPNIVDSRKLAELAAALSCFVRSI